MNLIIMIKNFQLSLKMIYYQIIILITKLMYFIKVVFQISFIYILTFSAPEIPTGYRCQSILGFVEELVVNDDPEYQWIDKIRTPRASNEARQTLFSKLSGELQRLIGLKVLELGGNAVIGLV